MVFSQRDVHYTLSITLPVVLHIYIYIYIYIYIPRCRLPNVLLNVVQHVVASPWRTFFCFNCLCTTCTI